MRFERMAMCFLAPILALAVSGCLFGSRVSSMSDRAAAQRKMKEQPVKVIRRDDGRGAPAVESTAAGAKDMGAASAHSPNEDPAKRLEADLRKRQAALAMERARTKSPLTVESSGNEPQEIKDAGDQGAKAVAPPAAAAAGNKNAAAETGDDLTVAGLRDRLSKKENRTPEEEEAYRRLSGAGQAETAPDDKSSAEWALLGDARDAIARNDFPAAREKAKQALALIRRKADPVIDRFCFARDVRSYGDADVIDPAEFGAGQKVLAVTDLSDFACMPTGNASPPSLYYAKISQRLAVYDGTGRLQWQKDYGTFEYQASHSISAMFIPTIFELPRDLKRGEYTLKVEITDALAGRRVETTARFTVK